MEVWAALVFAVGMRDSRVVHAHTSLGRAGLRNGSKWANFLVTGRASWRECTRYSGAIRQEKLETKSIYLSLWYVLVIYNSIQHECAFL